MTAAHGVRLDLLPKRARYALFGTALLTSPIMLPFELALLMLFLRGTPLGAAMLERLHLVYIGSVVLCLTALALACVPTTRQRTRHDSGT